MRSSGLDTSPVLERALARLAGIGWVSRHTCLIPCAACFAGFQPRAYRVTMGLACGRDDFLSTHIPCVLDGNPAAARVPERARIRLPFALDRFGPPPVVVPVKIRGKKSP